MPLLEVFFTVVLQQILAGGVAGPHQMPDRLVGHVLVLSLFGGEVLELFLQPLVEPFAGIAALIGHVFGGDDIVGLVPLGFLLGFHEFSALRENGVLGL